MQEKSDARKSVGALFDDTTFILQVVCYFQWHSEIMNARDILLTLCKSQQNFVFDGIDGPEKNIQPCRKNEELKQIVKLNFTL